MERAFDVLSKERSDPVFANLAAELGRLHFFKGEKDVAMERVDASLEVAESIPLTDVVSQALNTKGIILTSKGRPYEGFGLLRYSLEVALENDKPSAALRAYNNLAELLVGRYGVAGVVKHRKRGSVPVPDAVMKDLAGQCDAVITGSGD